MQQWIDEAWEKIVGKFTASSELAARMELIPYKSENGTWIASPFDGDSWWTNGFWPALMWQLYAGTEDERFLREARRVEKLLRKELMSFELLNHDVGFMYLLSSGADYKLTGSDEARRDTLHAATILAGRFNPTGFIRAWGQKGREGWAIVDCMMNLALLYWAHEQTGDPRFLKIARTHADTTMRCFVRPDGSCNHIVIFDPETGEMLDAPGRPGLLRGLLVVAWPVLGALRVRHQLPAHGRRALSGYGQACGALLHLQHPRGRTDRLRFSSAQGTAEAGQHRQRLRCLRPAGAGGLRGRTRAGDVPGRRRAHAPRALRELRRLVGSVPGHPDALHRRLSRGRRRAGDEHHLRRLLLRGGHRQAARHRPDAVEVK